VIFKKSDKKGKDADSKKAIKEPENKKVTKKTESNKVVKEKVTKKDDSKVIKKIAATISNKNADSKNTHIDIKKKSDARNQNQAVAQYIACPRCEINYIPSTEQSCKVCKAELGLLDRSILIPDFDELGDRLCPLCNVNYLNEDEEVCFLCSKEKQDKSGIDNSLEEDWSRDITDSDSVPSEEIEIISLSEIDEEESQFEDGDEDVFKDSDDFEYVNPDDFDEIDEEDEIVDDDL
jgi:hypothetical protein